MFFPLFLTLSISTYTYAQQCHSNITTCASIYQEKLIKPLGIDYVSLVRLRSTIRYYNYNYKLNNNHGKNKRQRRKFRRIISRNYNFYSYSKELDHMQHICDIHYDKLNIQKIKSKYSYAIKYSEHMKHKSVYHGFFIMFVIFFMGFILFVFTVS